MCELFAMSSRYPATVTLSLDALARHGGLTDHHRDGWGVAYYEQGDIRLIREAGPAYGSKWLGFLDAHAIYGCLVLSHIRKATQGDIVLRNTQPFSRELGGHRHVFAHNGHLAGLRDGPARNLSRYRPIGETDSELAFCLLMERMVPIWQTPPSLERRRAVVSQFAADMRRLGPANFLYSDGEVLFAHGHKRTQSDRAVRPPGLHRLRRHCPADAPDTDIDGLTIRHGRGEQDVTLFASVPLTDEDWQPLDEGAIAITKDGVLLS